MTTLIHGPELATVTIHLAPLVEVQRTCGSRALACYFPREAAIYAPAEDPKAGISAKGVLAHEFGHHIAASRLNPPFSSVDYGTKRWATYEDVCAKASAGDLYPRCGGFPSLHAQSVRRSPRVTVCSNEQRLVLRAGVVGHRHAARSSRCRRAESHRAGHPYAADREHNSAHYREELTGKVRTLNFALSTLYDGTRRRSRAAVQVCKGRRVAPPRERQASRRKQLHARASGASPDDGAGARVQAARDPFRQGQQEDEDDRDALDVDGVAC